MISEAREGEIPATIWLALRRATEAMERAGVDSPRLTAEVLMAHVLGRDRSGVLGRVRDPIAPEVYKAFASLVNRRVAGEPLQYLTGVREFFGLLFRVTPAVLIPRPETEFLVEKAVELARSRGAGTWFADVGTGSGCIAVSVANAVAGIRGIATDISQDALVLARENARALGCESRIEFVRCDLLECVALKPAFDFILCNPPYVAVSQADELPGVVYDHEPHQALFGGESGLEIVQRIVLQAAVRLAPRGRLLVEIGAGQAKQVDDFVRHAGLVVEEIVPDLRGIPRCVVARSGP